MTGYAPPIRRLIKELSRFPGIGEKTATRLATFLLYSSEQDATRLAESIIEVKKKIRFCSICFNLSESDVCEICGDPARDRDVICVVEDPDSLVAIEESGGFRGMYHVLHGVLSPGDGIGPESLRLRELIDRISDNGIKEVILATNPSVQGESTALLITKLLQGKDVRISRIAFGIPIGGDLKYVDRMTMTKAIEFRRGM
ncbi:MAG TPA: recombination mediator RecR [Syntrophales bacterium]|nr:recombination mediator RecR [Syntrophales bacterium]HPQ42683.1 recombination mediator RecR [Syntrophales bacterium]